MFIIYHVCILASVYVHCIPICFVVVVWFSLLLVVVVVVVVVYVYMCVCVYVCRCVGV